MPDPDPRPDLETASRRLDAALTHLESRAQALGEAHDVTVSFIGPDAGTDVAGLKAELEASRDRERQLEQVAAEAAAALGRAAAEVRAALAAQA